MFAPASMPEGVAATTRSVSQARLVTRTAAIGVCESTADADGDGVLCTTTLSVRQSAVSTRTWGVPVTGAVAAAPGPVVGVGDGDGDDDDGDGDEDVGLDSGLAAQRTRRVGARSDARAPSTPSLAVESLAILTSLAAPAELALPGVSDASPAKARSERASERTRCASMSLRTSGARRRMVVAIALSSSGAAPSDVRKA